MKGRLLIYNLKRKAFLKANPICQANLYGCQKKSKDIHHMKGRENDLLNETAYWMAICRSCHIKVTDDGEMAINSGLSISKHKKQQHNDEAG